MKNLKEKLIEKNFYFMVEIEFPLNKIYQNDEESFI